LIAEGEMKKVMLLVIATMYFAICESCNSLIKVCRELIAFYLKNFKNVNPYKMGCKVYISIFQNNLSTWEK